LLHDPGTGGTAYLFLGDRNWFDFSCLCAGRYRGLHFFERVSDVALAQDPVALINRWGLVAGDLHRYCLAHSGKVQVADRAAPQIVEEGPRRFRRLQGRSQGFSEIPDGLSVFVEDEFSEARVPSGFWIALACA